jgi:queuine tRNA-ribosyltransferase
MGAFTITHRDGKARAGLLKTRKGEIETPFFMPVATKASVKFLSSLDLEEMKVRAVISNMFVLHLWPGEKLIKKMGGIGNFMNFKGINVTDSGGFQMYSQTIYHKSDDKGVWFKNPVTQEKIFITPERDMKIQIDMGAEIAMCLDSMPLLHNSKKQIEEAVNLTGRWAQRCKREHDKLQKNIKKEKRQLLFGIIQGGIYSNLREKSAGEITKLGFDGYSIGGLALGETKEQEYRAIEACKKLIPEEKPVYLMGAGHPAEIMEAVSRGVDMFDSRFPTQNARRGTIFTSRGKLRIFNSKYKTDKKPLDPNCRCFVCRNYSRAYIRHQLKQEEGNGRRLATFHNLYYMQKLMEQARQAIKKSKFLKFKKKIEKIYPD